MNLVLGKNTCIQKIGMGEKVFGQYRHIPFSMCCHCSHHVHMSPVCHRWPKWRPHDPSLRTPTTLDHVRSPTQPSRGNWSPPNMAAGYSSGPGEAAPHVQSPFHSRGLCPETSSTTYDFKRFKSQVQARALRMLVLAHSCVLWSESWFWTELTSWQCLQRLYCTSNTVKQFDKGRKDGWLCAQSPWIHVSFLATSVNVMSEQMQHAVIVVVK